MASISCQVNEPDAIQMLFFFRNNNELFQKISTQQQAAGSRQQAAASQFERRLGKQKQQENKTKKPKAKVQTKVKSPKVGEIAMFAHAAKDVACVARNDKLQKQIDKKRALEQKLADGALSSPALAAVRSARTAPEPGGAAARTGTRRCGAGRST